MWRELRTIPTKSWLGLAVFLAFFVGLIVASTPNRPSFGRRTLNLNEAIVPQLLP